MMFNPFTLNHASLTKRPFYITLQQILTSFRMRSNSSVRIFRASAKTAFDVASRFSA